MCCGNVLTWAAVTHMMYYSICRDCKDHVAWHSDDESLFGRLPTIASVSLGDTRMFEMRKKVPPVSSCCKTVFQNEIFNRRLASVAFHIVF